ALPIAACVRIVTVTQTANVASMIMQKTTHEGIRSSRRRTAARDTEATPTDSSVGEESERAREAGRCVASRASVQIGLADILRVPPGLSSTSHRTRASCSSTDEQCGKTGRSDLLGLKIWCRRTKETTGGVGDDCLLAAQVLATRFRECSML